MLDTNIVIYTIKNRPAKVRKAFIKHEKRMGGLFIVDPVNQTTTYYASHSVMTHYIHSVQTIAQRLQV